MILLSNFCSPEDRFLSGVQAIGKVEGQIDFVFDILYLGDWIFLLAF